jgi:hypothetical protein
VIPPGLRTQLFELANAALFAPLLLVRLADGVQTLRFVFAQAADLDHAGDLSAHRQIAIAQRRDPDGCADDTDAQLRFLEILPAYIRHLEAADQSALHDHQPAAGRGGHDAAMGQRENAPLDRDGLECLAWDQELAHAFDGAADGPARLFLGGIGFGL